MRSVTVTPADSRIGNGPEVSCRQGGKSRVTGDCHARFRGSRRVRFPPATRLTNRRVDKSGQPREYVSHLLRRTYRDGAAVHAQAKALGLPALLGPAGRERDIALALIIARVCRPGSKLATTRWWADTTLADDLGVADASTDEVYAAMDWLAGRQDAIETKLVRTHLSGAANPDRLVLFDLSSSWMTGRCCPLAARGYSRDGKKGLPQIEYGLLTDPAGRPAAVRAC